jgi:hypothetical protein
MLYYLPAHLVERCTREARGRQHRAQRRGSNWSIDRQGEVSNQLCGIMAEVATCLLFGLPLDRIWDDRPDGEHDLILPVTGRRAEVKSAPKDTGHQNLIVPHYRRPDSAEIWIFAPVCGEGCVRFAGYIQGVEITGQRDFGRSVGGKPVGPQYCVPEQGLRPIQVLLVAEMPINPKGKR